MSNWLRGSGAGVSVHVEGYQRLGVSFDAVVRVCLAEGVSGTERSGEMLAAAGEAFSLPLL